MKGITANFIPRRFLVAWLLGILAPLLGSDPSPQIAVEVRSPGVLLLDVATERVLFEAHSSNTFYPANATKIATALFALERAPDEPPSTLITARRRWLRATSCEKNLARRYRVPPFWVKARARNAGIRPGETLTLADLYHAILLAGGDDAANLLAAHTCGTVESFMLQLNRFLRDLGCSNTQFLNPHGQFHPHHFTTPWDLAHVALRALQHPEFCKVVAKAKYVRPATDLQPPTVWRQTNRLLRRGKYRYERAVGIAAGFAEPAGHTLVATARDETRQLLLVLMGAASLDVMYKDAIALFDAGFALLPPQITRLKGAFALKPIPQGPIVEVQLAEPLELKAPTSQWRGLLAVIRWRSPLYPIAPNEVVAELDLVSAEGECLATRSLLALKASPIKVHFPHIAAAICGALALGSLIFALWNWRR